MLQAVYAQNLLHPHIKGVLGNLANVYEDQGRRNEALAVRERIEQNNETDPRSDRVASSSVCAVV